MVHLPSSSGSRAGLLRIVLGLCLVGLVVSCSQNPKTTTRTSGSSSSSTPSVSLNRPNVSLTSVQNSGVFPSTEVVAYYTGAKMVVGVPVGTTGGAWLTIKTNAISVGQVTYLLTANSTNMPAGTYTTTLRFSTARIDGSGQVYADLPITYILTPASTLTAPEVPEAEGPRTEELDPKTRAAHEAFARESGIEHILWATPVQ